MNRTDPPYNSWSSNVVGEGATRPGGYTFRNDNFAQVLVGWGVTVRFLPFATRGLTSESILLSGFNMLAAMLTDLLSSLPLLVTASFTTHCK